MPRPNRSPRIPPTKAGAIAQAPKPVAASESFRTLFQSALDQMQQQMNDVAGVGFRDHGIDPKLYVYDHAAGAFLPKQPAPPAAKPSK